MIRHSIYLLLLMILVQKEVFAKDGIYLPYFDAGINLQQAWTYELSMGGGRHRAFDFIDGPIDNSGPAPGHENWKSFAIAACYGGKIKYVPQNATGGSASWGNRIDHFFKLDGDDYKIIYAHLESSPHPANQEITCFAGMFLGMSGISGAANQVNHLHWEIYKKISSKWIRVDPYGISGYDDITYRSSYYPNAPLGDNHIFSTDPPRTFVGLYADGFHSDDTSQAFIKSHEWFSPKIGWPVDNGGGIFVHEWRGKADASFSVLAQDFLGNKNSDHFGEDARSVLILNDLEMPRTAYLLASGFYGYYKKNDGPYRFGVPITWEEKLRFSNSPLNNASDPVKPGEELVVQKFKRRRNGSYYNNERRTLVWKEGIEVKEFAIGEFSIDRCECSASKQWYIQGDLPQNDIPWPLEGVGVPTGRWLMKPGIYQFVLHDNAGNRIYGSQFMAVITEGNHQSAEPSIKTDDPDTQDVVTDPVIEDPDTQVVVTDPSNTDPDPPSLNFKGSVRVSSGFKYDKANGWRFIPKDTLTEVMSDTRNIYYLCQAENVKGRHQLRIEVYRDDVLWWPTDGKWGEVGGQTGITKAYIPMAQLQDKVDISDLNKSRVRIKILFFIKLVDENKESILAEGSYDIINQSVSVTDRFSKRLFPEQETLEYYDLMGRRIDHQEKRYLPQGIFIAKMKKLERRMLNVSK